MNTLSNAPFARLVRRTFTESEWALLALTPGFLESVSKINSLPAAEEFITQNARALLFLGRLETLAKFGFPPPRASP